MPSPSAPPHSSASSTPSSSPLGYLPALDGLRALAVAAVVAYHLGYSRVPGGYIGVEVFFVLSGWLVCALLAAEHRAKGGIDLKAFWLRRARRLLPAVTLVVGVTLVVALQARYHHFATLRGDGLAALGYVLNWRLIVDQQSYFAATAAGPSPLQHLWSLSIEEQFYLALPLLLGLALAGRRTAPRVALLALGAAVVATAWRLAVDAPGGDPSRLYYGTDTRAAGLLVGAALALVWVPSRLRPVPGRWAGPLLDLVALASLAVLGWYALEVDERAPDAFGWSLTVVQIASLTLIAVVVHPVRGLVARAMALRPLRWIGRRSYGIYLWHWPLIVLLAKAPGEQPETPSRAATIVVATLVIAAVSYRLVEQPIREHGVADALSLARRWTARHIAGRPVLTAAVTALAIVGYVGGVLLARDIVAADDITGDTPPTALATAGTSGDDTPGSGTAGDHGCRADVARPDPEVGGQTAPAETSPTDGTDATTASQTAAHGEPTTDPSPTDGPDATTVIATAADDQTAPAGTSRANGIDGTTAGRTSAGEGASTPDPTDGTDATTASTPAARGELTTDPSATNDIDATTVGGSGTGAGTGDRAAVSERSGCRSEAGGSGIDVAGAAPPAVIAGPPPVPPADPAGAGAGALGVPGDPAAGMAAPGPVPAPAQAPVPPWTTAIGDSVMQGAAPALQARFGPQLVIEATVGFQMVDAPELVQRLADEGRLGDVVVLHLGANGPFPDEVIDEIVAIAGRRPVLLVNVRVPRRWEAEVNDRIAAAAERHPRVTVVDWRTVSESEDGLLWRDGHHLTPAGAERYADLIASYAAEAGD